MAEGEKVSPPHSGRRYTIFSVHIYSDSIGIVPIYQYNIIITQSKSRVVKTVCLIYIIILYAIYDDRDRNHRQYRTIIFLFILSDKFEMSLPQLNPF